MFFIRIVFLFVASYCSCSIASANETVLPTYNALPEFSANYRVRVNNVPTGIEAAFRMQKEGDGANYHFFIDVDSALFNYSEHSHFNWKQCQAYPSEYAYRFAGFGLTRESTIAFDHQNRMATGTYRKETRPFPISPVTADGLSFAMMAWCDVQLGREDMHYHIAYGHAVYEAHVVVIGEEIIETPMGSYRTLVAERLYGNKTMRTRLWLAPDLDYFMVKFEHRENRVVTGSLLIESITFADTPTKNAVDDAALQRLPPITDMQTASRSAK